MRTRRPVIKDMDKSVGAGTTSLGDGSYRINISNGLLLYHHQYSYYSQKVVMALHEKKLPFEESLVDIMKFAQFEHRFLQINPRGEVPVLQDIGKIIPDSTRIIDYLEDNFSNGESSRLLPLDQGMGIRQKIMQFRQLLDQVPSGVLTMGSIFHPEFVKNPKAPFIFPPIRKMLANAENNSCATLRQHAARNPVSRVVLLQKAELQELKHLTVTNKDEFSKVLKQLDSVLDKVEEELASHGEENADWWLCTDRFTLADISLTILLERLNQLGFESRWGEGRRPLIERYYHNVKLRDSYKKTIPGMLFHVKMLIHSQDPVHVGIGVGAALVVIIGGVLILKKFFK